MKWWTYVHIDSSKSDVKKEIPSTEWSSDRIQYLKPRKDSLGPSTHSNICGTFTMRFSPIGCESTVDVVI